VPKFWDINYIRISNVIQRTDPPDFSNSDVSISYRITAYLAPFSIILFVELDHDNKYSAKWNNDKLFILIKNN